MSEVVSRAFMDRLTSQASRPEDLPTSEPAEPANAEVFTLAVYRGHPFRAAVGELVDVEKLLDDTRDLPRAVRVAAIYRHIGRLLDQLAEDWDMNGEDGRSLLGELLRRADTIVDVRLLDDEPEEVRVGQVLSDLADRESGSSSRGEDDIS